MKVVIETCKAIAAIFGLAVLVGVAGGIIFAGIRIGLYPFEKLLSL